mmetsp:Transcript_40008/g.82325  ORF Transcript_40008/g.82325 Transcript_40008/m.82325 type:complete len:237 (-) Transcript_40008:1023-1733(-)
MKATVAPTLLHVVVVLVVAGSASAFAPTPLANVGTNRSCLSSPKARSATSIQMQNLLGGIFGDAAAKEKGAEAPKIPDFVVTPSYSLAIGFVFYSLFFVVALQASILGVILGGLNLLFASFLAVQTNRLRFVFDETSFELKSALSGDLSDTGENVVVGGANRWTYDSFVNWDFFPSRDIPILVYFKETQTPSDKWEEGPGQLDKVGGGQIHFFPAIADCRELEEQFTMRGCAKIED